MDTREAFAKARDRIDHPPLVWMPTGTPAEPLKAFTDPKIVGAVEELDEWQSDFGPYPTILLRTEDGKRVRVHGFGEVLKNQIVGKKVRVGDIVGLNYLGKATSRTSGRDYENYDLTVVRGESPAPSEDTETASSEDDTPIAAPQSRTPGLIDDDDFAHLVPPPEGEDEYGEDELAANGS